MKQTESNTGLMHVLLADDDEDDRALFEKAISGSEIRTPFSSVKDGDELMRTLTAGDQLPDVVFIDLNMPRKNGFECLVRIKANPATKELPVVIITTWTSDDVIKVLFDNGALRFMTKPKSLKKLTNLIQKALQAAKASSKPDSIREFVLR